MAGGPAGGGQGGTPNLLPGRGFPEFGSATYRDMADWTGGARGPAALPSRSIATVGNGPAPVDPRIRRDLNGNDWHTDTVTIDGTGAQGPVSYHRGAYVEDAGGPRLYFDGTLGHGDIPWSRPTYGNVAGQAGYHAPTRMSWTANHIDATAGPASPIPVSRKHIGNFTVRRPFGDTSSGELFRTGPLDGFVRGIQKNVQGRRWVKQSKTHSPTLLNRSTYNMAGSYGQTTKTVPTSPTNLPANPYGVY